MKTNYTFKRILFFVGLLTLFSYSSYACNYQLKMYDSYGDGWNGGKVTVKVNGTAVLVNQTVSSGHGPVYVNFAVNTGDLITTDYTAGSWSSENEYWILDAYGAVVGHQGASGTPGDITTAIVAICPSNNDLSVIEWTSPTTGSSPDTAMTITVKVKNVGLMPQDTFAIKYSVDAGTTIITETYNDTLWPDSVLTYSFTTTANMGTPGMYHCGAVVSNPGDTTNFNDTIFADVYLCYPMTGIYTVGPDTADDFSSVSDAATAVSLCGVSGPVTFMIDSGTYNGKVLIESAIAGASATNTITFKGLGSNTVITASTNSGDRDVVRFMNTAHIIFDSLKITTPYTNSYNCGIRIMNSDSITVKNCTISMPTNTTSSYTNGILVVGSKTSNYSYTRADYLTFDNNTINGGYYGIKLYGNSSTSNLSTVIKVRNNTFNNFYYYGVYSYNQDSIDVKNNTLTSRPNSYGYGIYAYKARSGSRFAYNNILLNTTSSGYGMYINRCEGTSSSPIMVYNNMISIPNATSTPYGIYSYYGKNVNYYYNSIRIGNGGSNSRAMYIYGSTSSSSFANIKIKDNVLVNSGAGYAMYMYGTYYPAKVTECDYNNMYTTGSKFAYYGSNKANLAAWQAAATGLGTNSKSIDPGFLSATNLHSASIPMNNLGTPITGIDDDIDGDLRNLTTPDMGADEYTPPANEVAIIEYLGVSGGGCGMTATEPVTIVVKNNGTNNQTSIPVKFTVDGGTVVSETIASLASLAIDTFTFSATADLSAIGMHNLVVYVDMTVDENRNNDTAHVAVKAIGSIANFPYFQGFDSIPNDFEFVSRGESSASISTRAGNGTTSGLLLTGGSYNNWSGYYNVTGAFNNASHVSKAFACDVNATSLSNLKMKFDEKMNYTYNTNYGWFRVLINDSVYAKDLNGDSTWHASSTHGDAFQSLVFDLTAYAGTQFTISLEAACKYNKANYGSWGDEVFIDNFKLWEPAANDVGVSAVLSPSSANCGLASDTVLVTISNFGLDTQYTFPVKIDVTFPSGTTSSYTTTFNDTLAPNASANIQLGPINTTASGTYSIVAYTQLTTDTTYNNNDTTHADFSIDFPQTIPYVQNFEFSTPVDYSGYGYRSYDSYSQSEVWKQYMSKYYINRQFNFNKKIGPVDSTSYFIFDFKNAYNSTATTMNGDNLIVLISNDCGVNYDTLLVVDSSNHATSNQFQRYTVPLTSYIGDEVHLRFISNRDNSSSQYSSYFYFDNVAIIHPPAVDLGPDTSYCAGDTAILDAGQLVGATYLWTRGLDTVGTTYSIQVTTPGTYIAHVNQLGLTGVDAVNIIFNPKPAVSFTGLNSSYCDNEMPSTLMPTPAGGTFTGNGISGTTFDPSMSGIGNHVITYTYTTSAGCTSMTSDTTDVFEAALVNLMDTTICEGDSVVLTAGSNGPVVPDLIFSSYIEGSSNNKAIEVYNATTDTLDLDNYSIMTNYNGNPWSGQYHFPAGTKLAPGDVFVVANNQADSTIIAVADDTLPYNGGGYIVGFNGDDVRALFKHSATDSMMIDIIGRYDLVDPGSGWDVAGVSDATKNHTLVRKSTIVSGNTDWNAIAGTDSLSSEYLVYPKNTFTYLGSHSATPPVFVPNTYLWSTGDTTASITVMPSATTTYSVTVNNGNCQTIDSAVVTVNPLPIVNLGPDTSFKWTWESITLDAGNPNASSWDWSTGGVAQTETFDSTVLSKGPNTVYVTVTENNCSASDTVIITVIDDVSINGASNNMNIEVYPSPTKGRFNMTINGYKGKVQMSVIDLAGQVVHSEIINVTANYNGKFDLSKLSSGVYYIKLTSNNVVKIEKLIIQK